MKEIFKNKTVCFLGDSIVTHGGFIYDIRAYFQGKKDKIIVYNRGTAGNKSVFAPPIFDKEIEGMNPNYVIVSFGVNDLGIWLYDTKKQETEELLKKRSDRHKDYFKGIRDTLNSIIRNGITPIIASPFPVNEMIIEKEGIETVGDNKEKEDYIGPSFYTRANFKNINKALKFYADSLKLVAEEFNITYLPIYESIYPKTLVDLDLFTSDGIHYSAHGHDIIAKTLLEFFGCDANEIEFAHTPENDEIARLERLERRAGYLRRTVPFHPLFGEFTDEQVFKHARELLKSPTDWVREVGQVTLDYYYKIDELRKQIFTLTKKL